MIQWLGFKWLSSAYHVDPVHPFRKESQIGSTRKSSTVDGYTQEYYPPTFTPDPTFAGHLAFALKHEGIHLEFLARLFHKVGPDPLEAWIRTEPTGAYSRRAGFLYEWLTRQRLHCEAVTGGNYVDAINEIDYFTASESLNNQRWRVRDNLPGSPDFCPTLHRSPAVTAAEQYDCSKALQDLEAEYGNDILMRSAVWLTIKESRSSFAIEHEEKQADRIKRFAAVMESRCGKYPNPLSDDTLRDLQKEILGTVATRYGLRKSPVFVGHADGHIDIVDYIAPHWNQVGALLGGLHSFDQRTQGKGPVVRAAVMSFGFVYIHPMSDGNGRISRFLVNDVLRRDKAVPEPYILPISATITHTPSARAGYDRALEQFSRPLMRHYKDNYRFGTHQVAEDGIKTNLQFDAYDDAIFAWRFPDMTSHVEYLANVVHKTIAEEMHQEAEYMRNMMTAREGVKDLMEGPNADIDRIIRSIKEHNWSVSNKLRKEFPLLASVPGLPDRIVLAIKRAFKVPEPEDDIDDETEPSAPFGQK